MGIILIYQIVLYIGVNSGEDTWRKSTRNGKEKRQNAKGRQVITLNLTITLRVMLARIL